MVKGLMYMDNSVVTMEGRGRYKGAQWQRENMINKQTNKIC